MSGLRLLLLGPPRLEREGVPLELDRRKAMALLAYLAVTGQAHRRETLAVLFWPDLDKGRAHAYLRRTLWALKQVLGEEGLAVERDSIGPIHPANPATLPLGEMTRQLLWVDVVHFQHLLADCGTHGHPAGETCPACLVPLTEAAELYQADFMAGFTLADSPEFDEWQLFQAESLRRELAGALERLVRGHNAQGQFDQAIPVARRWLALDPLHEPAHRQLMQLYTWADQRTAALRQYEECKRLLAEELGVPPEKETSALYEAIKARQVTAPKYMSRGAEEQGGRGDANRFSSASLSSRSVAPFVARERELAQLKGFLDQALAGQGRVVFVSGEAGSGKTALIWELARQAQATHPDLVVAGGNCNAHTGWGDPYLPFREILEMLTGDLATRATPGVINAEQARRLEGLTPHTIQVLLDLAPELIDTLTSGPALLSRAEGLGSGDAAWLDPLRQLLARRQAGQGQAGLTQHYLFEQYTRVMQALARQIPLLLVLDDLQWADAGSLNLLFHLGRRLAGSRLLVVGAYRPTEVTLGRDGERHPLETVMNEFQRQFGSIPIHLSQADNREFVDAFLDTKPNRLSATFREALYRHTGGQALFTVEMLREMQERGDLVQDEAGRWMAGPAVQWQRLPARVEGVIGERIGRLPAALQETLQVASVEGEEFTAEVVAQTQGTDGREIVRQLSGVLDQQHRLVRGQGSRRLEPSGPRLSRYRFRHILFQKYVYDSLDEAQRVYLHEAVGHTLERLYGAQTEEVALELARHFEAAGLTDQAIGYLHQAGERAVRLSADEEAITHFGRALALLQTLPGTPNRAGQELTLQIALGYTLMAARGYAAPKVEQAFLRARELCQHTHAEDSPQLFTVLLGLCGVFYLRAEYRTGRELAEQLLELAQRAQKRIRLLWARFILAEILFYMGEFLSAQTHLGWDLAFYDPRRRSGHAHPARQDPAMSYLGITALVLGLLGNSDQALKKQQEALALARQLNHPFSLAYALSFDLRLAELRREAQIVQTQAEAAITLCTEYGFPYWLAWATIYRGWALVKQCPQPVKGQEQAEAGIAQIRQGLAAYLATGAEAGRPRFLVLLAEAYQQVGQVEEGLNVLAEALTIANRTGERSYEAEIHRLKGELLLQAEAKVEAEACLLRAIQVALQQQARIFELRATVSLARLWQSQGKQVEAKQMLTEIYGWFTEGFDTVDLQEAKALLEAL